MKTIIKRIQYWDRIIKAYVLGKKSQLTFWHGEPKINKNFNIDSLGPYYMSFNKKAEYQGFFDKNGIPMLDYQGVIGLQYNPIAIAQWGLGNYNLWYDLKSEINYKKFILCADWLINNLEMNSHGYKVWMHHFDWEYRDLLQSPWYSGLAQGQGISVLIRAYEHTKKDKYLHAINDAIQVFMKSTDEGGVNYFDENNNNWIEEYIVHPPTHILNGFIWGLWGIYDYLLVFNDQKIKNLYDKYIHTLLVELHSYDTGYWSLYEHSGTNLKMIASLFYHKLHIVQLRIMYSLTGEIIFDKTADKWSSYLGGYINRKRAFLNKIIFKIFYY